MALIAFDEASHASFQLVYKTFDVFLKNYTMVANINKLIYNG
jgi:hypothetical protein